MSSEAQARRAAADRMREVARSAGVTSGPAIQRELEKRLTEMFAAGGVSEARTALEIVYMLPDSFREEYMKLFHRSLGMADGQTGVRGKAQESTAALGRAPGKTPGGGGKKFKTYWVVRDESALDLKGSIDKRLRALARDIRTELEAGDAEARGATTRPRCPRCSGIVALGWKFCASCGQFLREVD